MGSDAKSVVWWGAALALLLAVWIFFAPVVQAKLRYSSLEGSDEFERCDAAAQLANAWAGAGFAGRAKEWRSRADAECALGRLTNGGR